MQAPEEPALWCWRHPRATGAAGRCIGQTDLPVDRRRARRLAHRIRQNARRHQLPREVWVSPLARARAVGRWLRRWGWRVHVDARLMELDFGGWDGLPWTDIAWPEVQAWQAGLLHHRPGGGESLADLLLRARAFVASVRATQPASQTMLVGHGGWINALLQRGMQAEDDGQPTIDAARWPAAPPHGSLTVLGLRAQRDCR